MDVTEKIAKNLENNGLYEGGDASIIESISCGYPFRYKNFVYACRKDAYGCINVFIITDKLEFEEWMDDALVYYNECNDDRDKLTPERFNKLDLLNQVVILTNYFSPYNLDSYPENFKNILEILIYLNNLE